MVETIKKDLSWLVIGSTGQLGSEITTELRTRNLQLISPNKIELDITNWNHVFEYFEQNRPKVVVNAAAWTDVESSESSKSLAYKINAEGANNLALASKEIGAKFIHISTDYVFSGKSNAAWEIDSAKEPISEYGRSKSIGEDLILSNYDIGAYIFRTSWLYSKYRKNFVKSMIKKALDSKNIIKVVDDQIGQPTNARDLSKRVIESIENDIQPGIYHATNVGETSWYEFARLIFDLIGENSERVIPMPSNELASKVKRPEYSVLGQKCWENTGMQPMRNWEIALREQIYEIKDAVLREGDDI